MSARMKVAGFTMVELMVVLLLTSLLSAVAVTAFTALDGGADSPSSREAQLRAARRQAIIEGRPVTVFPDSVAGESVLFLPDGRAVGAGVDALLGTVTEGS